MTTSTAAPAARSTAPTVDIIVPVYRDLAVTRRCVEAVLARTDSARADLILVNDASPEPELAQWCQQLGDEGRITLLNNETNRGFAASVNLGISRGGERDVVVLNSDTEVPPGWLDRLQQCALQADDIATVTPFSNNGTICSYPRFFEDCELPAGLDLETLDTLFHRANAGRSLEIPTAVGFCMYLRRSCLEQIGLFDEALYGRGYGEENDFSQRASVAGWRNVICADLFVYHQGAVSFREDRRELMEHAETRLLKRYPGYTASMARFFAEDPLQDFRNAVNRLRLEIPGQADQVVQELADSLRVARYKPLPMMETMQEQEEALQRLQRECSEARATHEAEIREYQRNLDETREAYARTDEALGEAQQVVDRYREELDQQVARNQELEAKLDQIRNSRLWRYSRPLRQLLDRQ